MKINQSSIKRMQSVVTNHQLFEGFNFNAYQRNLTIKLNPSSSYQEPIQEIKPSIFIKPMKI